jgi:hypothetical protein
MGRGGTKSGDAMARASWLFSFLEHPGAKFFLRKRGLGTKAKKMADIMLAGLAGASLSGMPHAVMVQLSDSNRVWNWALSWCRQVSTRPGTLAQHPFSSEVMVIPSLSLTVSWD